MSDEIKIVLSIIVGVVIVFTVLAVACYKRDIRFIEDGYTQKQRIGSNGIVWVKHIDNNKESK